MSLARRLQASVRIPRDTVARWIALTTLAAMLTALLLNGLFTLLAGVWARPPLMESGLMERLATVARVIESVAPGQRPAIADAASDASFNVEWMQQHDEARVPPLDEPGFKVGSAHLRRCCSGRMRRSSVRTEATGRGTRRQALCPADRTERRLLGRLLGA